MKKYLTENKFYVDIDKRIQEAESFTATNKKSGKTSVFKSKDARDAAIKSGTHTAKKDNKGGGGVEPKNDTPKVNIFNKPSADNNKFSVDDTKQATQSIVSALGRGYDSENIEYWAKRTRVDLSQVSKAIESGELDIRDLKTYISIPELPAAQKMVAKYGGPEYVEEPVAKRQSKFKSSKPVKIDDIEDYSDIEDVIDTYKDKLPDNEKKALEVLHAAWQDAEAKMIRSGNDDKYEERVSKILTKLEKVLSNAGILSK